MANFKHYFDSRFAGCLLLAKAFDHHRNRDVNIYRIPGHEDCVGVSDGVDRWVAPVVAELFSVDIQKVLRCLQDDPKFKLPVVAAGIEKNVRQRRRVPLVDQPAPARRRLLVA